MTKVTKMSVKEFIDIPDNDRQRDTVRHARKAMHGHLSETSPTHSLVSVASINGDVVCKLDGHTRAYLWDEGLLPLPPKGKVTAIVYEVSSMKEASELYTHFDNQSAMEASCDRLFGACRESGLVITSPLLRAMKFTVALRLASNQKGSRASTSTEYEMVSDWSEELTTLDSWQLPAIPGPIVGLALLAIRGMPSDVDKVHQFYESFCNDAGVKNGRDRDGVQSLSDHLQTRRTNKTMTGWDNINDFAERALTCLKAYVEGRSMSGGVRRSSIESLRVKSPNASGGNIEKDQVRHDR